MRKKVGSSVLLVTGFLACPCHLPLTLPLLITLLGGTALGGWLSTHTGLVIGLSTGYFIAALVVGFVVFLVLFIVIISRSLPNNEAASAVPDVTEVQAGDAAPGGGKPIYLNKDGSERNAAQAICNNWDEISANKYVCKD